MTNQTGNIGLLALNDALPLSENLDGSIYVPGMGIGASKDALRWATAGMLDELLRNQKNRKPFGRPVRDFMEKVDNRRAFMLWALVNIDPISPNLKFASNREKVWSFFNQRRIHVYSTRGEGRSRFRTGGVSVSRFR